jgi:hypothetical protein
MKNGLAAVTVIYNVVNPRWRLVSRKISTLFNHPTLKGIIPPPASQPEISFAAGLKNINIFSQPSHPIAQRNVKTRPIFEGFCGIPVG